MGKLILILSLLLIILPSCRKAPGSPPDIPEDIVFEMDCSPMELSQGDILTITVKWSNFPGAYYIEIRYFNTTFAVWSDQTGLDSVTITEDKIPSQPGSYPIQATLKHFENSPGYIRRVTKYVEVLAW